MAMTWIWTGMVVLSLFWALCTGRADALGAAALEGAAAAIQTGLGLCGGLCLWSGVMEALERSGAAGRLARLLRPVLGLLFPGARGRAGAVEALAANVSANLLGLGSAATPMGIRAAKLLHDGSGTAGRELCTLVVMNTASIQLIPATVCALRASLGSADPFGILPAVWITSAASLGVGLLAAAGMERLWKRRG